MIQEDRDVLATVSPFLQLAERQPETTGQVEKCISEQFTRLRESGVSAVALEACVCGRTLYPTEVATPFSQTRTAPGCCLGTLLRGMDVPGECCACAKDAGLEVFLVLRLWDDYFPGLASQFEAAHRHCRWESRDGEFSLPGVLSLAYDEVAGYRLEMVEELCARGADGVALSAESKAAAFTPFRRLDFFGFNEPYARAHMERFGEDIHAFDTAEYRRGPDLQLVDAVYSDGKFNAAGWHALKGEFLERFLERASKAARKSGKRLAFLRGRDEGILPMARMALPADTWLAGGIIDDLFLPEGPGDDRSLDDYLEEKSRGARVFSGDEDPRADGAVVPAADILSSEGSE